MKSTSESLSRPETSNGIAAEGNCVVVRRGGEQPEADLRSQTRVNPIRFTTAASLLASGEACRTSGNRFLPHPSYTGEKRDVVDGWGENAGKVSCGRVEICPGRKVRRNAGSCGVDGITIGRFEPDSQNRLLAVKEHLSKGTYQPKPVKRVWIDKPGSVEKRPLGIPTVTDRVVQAAS